MDKVISAIEDLTKVIKEQAELKNDDYCEKII